SLRVIEAEAFESCKALKTVNIKEGLTHIGDEAFKDCKALKEIHIPYSVGMIAEDAFEGDNDLVIHCGKGSYAHEYAIQSGIEFVTD
ncbi:MAG: leucine-rich repeat protein, partial [Firmicutes bacterium]|nr:leucine-rich repeat protein [Bacillota bacterium]